MIIQSFSEIILKNGGWRESHDGDSSYGHFGLLPLTTNPYECALATAREFRETLKGINARFGTKVECGISLHIAKDSLIHVHSVHMSTPHGLVTQKSFDTNSVGIDQLHRIEKLVHTLPGTNIIASEEFLSGLNQRPSELLDYGGYTPKAGESMLKLFLIEPSPETLKAKNQAPLKQVA
jgi:class 3 adenylate cyclase